MAISCASLQFVLLLTLVLLIHLAVCAPPRSLSTLRGLSRNELITVYFFDGYGYKKIIILLRLLHGICLSLRQLKRILRELGLRRRVIYSFTYLRQVETVIRVSKPPVVF